jgi:hypothetical protein
MPHNNIESKMSNNYLPIFSLQIECKMFLLDGRKYETISEYIYRKSNYCPGSQQETAKGNQRPIWLLLIKST